MGKIIGIKVAREKVKFSSVVIANAIISAYPHVASAILRYGAATVIYQAIAGIKNSKGIQLCMGFMRQYKKSKNKKKLFQHSTR